jgi:hypothetical protein
MTFGQLTRSGLAGIRLFFWTWKFFYSHPSLVLLSLIPSTFRLIQMWNDLQTPLWMEIAVESARVVLFFLILSLMAKTEFRRVFRKQFWDGLGKRAGAHLERNWPHVFLAQIVVFVVLMFCLMNVVIEFVLGLGTVPRIMSLLGIESYDDESAYNALLFFIKNMTNIPMSMVYIMRMCGVGIK